MEQHDHCAPGKGSFQMPRVRLGSQGFEVSKLGFGCMGLTGIFKSSSGPPVDEETGIAVILRAFQTGVTFFDTADIYGPLTNEVIIGKALKQLPREQVQVATKFGIEKIDLSGITARGTPEYVRASCEASLARLGVDYIDLYYQHRIDTSVPIEETMGELKKLVEEGKVKYLGLSEASPDTIRRAHAVHPITAIQIEWSLWARDIEEVVVPLCRKLGIGVVTYSPLGRGFFAGKAIDSSHPRLSGENIEKNMVLYERLRKLAERRRCTPAQLALAWVLHQGEDVVPIPGTTKMKNLDDNIGSLMVRLTGDDLREITAAFPPNDVAGERTYAHVMRVSWEFADTPPPSTLASGCMHREIILDFVGLN